MSLFRKIIHFFKKERYPIPSNIPIDMYWVSQKRDKPEGVLKHSHTQRNLCVFHNKHCRKCFIVSRHCSVYECEDTLLDLFPDFEVKEVFYV